MVMMGDEKLTQIVVRGHILMEYPLPYVFKIVGHDWLIAYIQQIRGDNISSEGQIGDEKMVVVFGANGIDVSTLALLWSTDLKL